MTVEDAATRERAAVTGLDGVMRRIDDWIGAAPPAPGLVEGLRGRVESLRAEGTPLELCGALIDLGRELHRCASPAEAREVLAEAGAIAQEQRSDSLERMARATSIAAGARPRRSALRGPDALTRCERRVAELVACGCTNREVAATLVVSEKTVEGHLRSVFRKLGIRSRVEIAGELGGDARPAAARPASGLGPAQA